MLRLIKSRGEPDASDRESLVRGLLRLYFLWCIGELTAAEKKRTRETGDAYRKLSGKKGTWYELVEREVGWTMASRREMKMYWKKRLAVAGIMKLSTNPRVAADEVAPTPTGNGTVHIPIRRISTKRK